MASACAAVGAVNTRKTKISTSLRRGQREPGLEHEAEQDEARAGGVGHARRVQPREEVRHADEPEPADQDERARRCRC